MTLVSEVAAPASWDGVGEGADDADDVSVAKELHVSSGAVLVTGSILLCLKLFLQATCLVGNSDFIRLSLY